MRPTAGEAGRSLSTRPWNHEKNEVEVDSGRECAAILRHRRYGAHLAEAILGMKAHGGGR